METSICNDNLSIDSMSQSLFEIHKAIALFREQKDYLDCDSLYEINKAEVYALLLASRIDVTICFKNLKFGIGKYEGCFYLNIAFMKMMEIMNTLMDATTKKDNNLYYNPNQELCKEVTISITEWRKLFTEWIKPKRNTSSAHYEPDFLKYMNAGYTDIDPDKNQECFSLFYKVTQSIFSLIRPSLKIDK